MMKDIGAQLLLGHCFLQCRRVPTVSTRFNIMLLILVNFFIFLFSFILLLFLFGTGPVQERFGLNCFEIRVRLVRKRDS